MLRKALCLVLVLSMLLSVGVCAFATPKAETKAIEGAVNGVDYGSTKTLKTGTQGDDKFTLEIDAFQKGSVETVITNVPLDVTIVMDRSQSMSQPASTSAANYKSFTSYYPGAILYQDATYGWWTFDHEDIVESTSIKNEIAKINAYLNTLDKNAYEGYYRATNYLKRGGAYFVNNHVGFAAEGFASWEPLRYNTSKKQWEMRVTNGLWGGDFPGGINTMDFVGGDIRNKQVEWMSVTEAYKEYCARNRRNIYTGKQVVPGSNGETTGYTGYYDFVIATPRLTKAIDATETFIKNIYESSKTLPAGQSHRVSILSFGTGAFYNGGKYAYSTYDAVNDSSIKVESTLTYDLGVSKTITDLNTEANLNSLLTVLHSSYTYTNTRTDWALEAVESNSDFLPNNDGTRKQVVVLITDGAPTYADNMQSDVADKALVAGKQLKGEDVSIYTIGFMPDLDDSKAVADFNSSNPGSPDNANSFLKLLSSYYPESESVTATEGYTMADTENPFYKADDGTGEKLNEIYNAMQDFIIETEYERVFFEADSLLLFDEITREFKLDSAGKIQVYALPYQGNNKFGTAQPIGTHNVSQPTASSPVSIPGKGYNITLTKNGELTDVTLNWIDSKYAFARETAFDTGGTYGSTYLMGYKILLKLPLVVNRDNTLGGNNINTNTASSGFYLSPDAGATDALGELIHSYPVPNANVSFSISGKVYDYFVDLPDYIEKLQNVTPGSTEAQKIFEAMYSGINDYLSLLQDHKNDYLKFDMSLYNSLKQLLDGWYANAGATSFTTHAPASGASFDFLKDQVLSFVLSLTPVTSKNDSCADVTGGVAPYAPAKVELSPNYYGPKYVVVDFDEVVKTPLDKESGLNPALQSGQKSGKIENGNICFDLRATYGTGNKSFLQGEYTTVKYQVTPINATKTQGTATTVARNFYVIPANVMTYDDTMLTFGAGTWETIGAYSDSVQSHDNSVTHGYDSIYNSSTYSASYYHNAQKGVTVSNANGTAQASFTILGTGFDIFSMTSSNSGMMAVEVSTDSAFKNDIRTFIVDTYLEGQTLYQIPVVRCDDLEYGTYYVRITAFYDSIFDHHYISPWKNGVVTEEKLRERYGIAEDADFTFIPSASGYDQPATRIADAKHGQYNVYVDGIRVYNTLGNVSSNAIANYAYLEAGEGKANIININDALVDADNADSWKQGTTVNGVLYMAAGKTTAEQGDQSKGIILGMEGALYTKASGAKFYVYKDAALTEPVTYKGNNVYYRKTTTTSPNDREFSGLNFYYDGGSAANPMTRAEVVEAFGSIPTYYNSNYSAMGPEKEIYLNGSNGVAFKVGTGASKVMLSLKSHNGEKATLQIYDGSKFVTLAATTSRVEMYYDITKYINGNGYVFVKNDGGISAICNLKVIGTAIKSITIDAGLAAEAARVFKYAGLPVEESAQIMHSLDLQSDIALNYVVKTELLAEYDNSYLEVEFDGINYSLAPEVRGDLAYFTMEGITAVEMTEELRATLHLFMGEEEYVSETDVYCVADYAYAQLSKAEASAELKAVCANLLRYGAEAQSYKSYNTDKLADADLTEEQKSYLTDLNTLVLENKAQALADGEAIWEGKTLVLDTKVTLKAVFDLSGFEGDMSALNLRVSYTDCAGEQIALSLTDVQVYNAEKALYSFDLDTLDAADLRSILTMALYEGDAQLSETQVYSVESYCATKTGALGDLCKALMAYSDSAKAYFAN